MSWAKPRLNGQPFGFFAQLHENALFFCIYQLDKYQTLFLVDCIVFSQIPGIVFAFLPNTGSCKQGALKFGHTKIWFTINKRLKKLFCYFFFFFFSFSNLASLLWKIYEKKKQNMYFQNSSTSQKLMFWKPFIATWWPFEIFWNLKERSSFWQLIFTRWNKYGNLIFRRYSSINGYYIIVNWRSIHDLFSIYVL